ncbi:MAG: HNH endonuclease [Marmoricola sp.]
MGRVAVPVEERFWQKVEKTETCWLWSGHINFGGYGKVTVNYKSQFAHRVSYQITKGEIPDGMFVDHICHNRACVNPAHLRLATNKQNHENLSGAPANSTSGIRGVSWRKASGKWEARVGHNGHKYYLGMFDDIKLAEAAVVAKRNELFTHNILDRMAETK